MDRISLLFLVCYLQLIPIAARSNVFISVSASYSKQRKTFNRDSFEFRPTKTTKKFSLILGKRVGSFAIGAVYDKYLPIYNRSAYMFGKMSALPKAKYKSDYLGAYISYDLLTIGKIVPFVSISYGKSVNQWYEETAISNWKLLYKNRKSYSSAYNIGVGIKYNIYKNMRIFALLNKASLGTVKRNKQLAIGERIYLAPDISHKLQYKNIAFGVEYLF